MQEQRIIATIDAWKRKLLDLSKRNRALNFKVNKVSTVVIVDEQPSEIFRLLCLEGKSLKFKPSNEIPKQEASETKENELWDEVDEAVQSTDFQTYKATALEERHTDDVLQTTSTPDALDKSLRRIDEQALTIIEEQGVNALFLALGMLYYKEASHSNEFFKAPLILVPVALSRKSARTGYTIKATDDDAIVNPSLIEYLRQYKIKLPELPETFPDDYNLQDFFKAALEVVSSQTEWSVKNEIYLGLFSFQKIVMYKDLEKNTEALSSHRLINQFITRTGNQFVGLPDDVREMVLDKDFPPEKTFQVVDADSSQLRAIAAVSRNYDLVLEGPPGTGKSQTITNLIAQTLSQGKSVLFVAEKMAALQVVYNRLVSAGLGEFCLELHSTKANKRALMQELKTSLDATLQRVHASTISTQRLPLVRQTLTEYVNAVHMPFGVLDSSPYKIYGELGAVLDAPKVSLKHDISKVTKELFDDTVRAIEDMAAASVNINDTQTHSWRDTNNTFYSEQDLDEIGELTDDILQRLDVFFEQARKVENGFGFPPIRLLADVDVYSNIASSMAESPGAPLVVLQNEVWNNAPPDAIALIERGRKISKLKENTLCLFKAEILDENHADDITYIEQKSQGILSFLSFLDSRYRAIKARWLNYRLPNYHAGLIEQAHEMKSIVELKKEQQALSSQEILGRQLFGGLWQGEKSDWDALSRYVDWVVKFRGYCIRHGLREKAFDVAAKLAPDVSDVNLLSDQTNEIRKRLSALIKQVAFDDNYFAQKTIEETATRVRELNQNISLAPRWAAFETTRQKVEKSFAAELLPVVLSNQISFADLSKAFKRAFYQKWLTLVLSERESLREFNSLTHEQRVKEFQVLDEKVLHENRAALVSQLRDEVQNRLRQPETSAIFYQFLKPQLSRQKGIKPIRRIIQESEKAIRAIKPCFLMSPQSVAQFLDGSKPSFDLIIFDEASQLPAEDAVGAIIRGNQLVVVGDPKQLPPTNFFTVSSGQATVEYDEDGTPIFEDSESILEEFMGAAVPNCRLKWHYRSAHESLINFSNVSFYDSDLYTFPSVESLADDVGVKFEFVEGGVYEGKGLNIIEARRVADAVVRHAKLFPELSLGVGTFNLRQQLAIQDELEQRRRQDPSIEPFFSRNEEEPFFVKNLENIQGDERDVIFLSVTYAKGNDGRLRYNFGPINGQNGWRRLNVLTTRARKLMRVFSSMRGDEINAAATVSRGAQLMRDFLLFAERGRIESIIVSKVVDTESPFEREVFNELTKYGYSLTPQVGVSGYRIDLGVQDNVVAGRFICGIECDGVSYHSSETARDRDRLRQQVLEARGWTIHRVWSTDWFKDRAGQIERLTKLIEGTRERSLEEEKIEQEEIEAASQPKIEETKNDFGTVVQNMEYVRPIATPYKFANNSGRLMYSDFYTAPISDIANVILHICQTEAPIHFKDLVRRVASIWGFQQTGSRITERVLNVCYAAERSNMLIKRDEFIWLPNGVCRVRSRSGTGIPAEHIAPEEIQTAILMILESGRSFERRELINEVRAVFGFSRTGASLETVINEAVEELLAQGKVGEGGLGIALRR